MATTPGNYSTSFLTLIRQLSAGYGYTPREIYQAMARTDQGARFAVQYLRAQKRRPDASHAVLMRSVWDVMEDRKEAIRRADRDHVLEWRRRSKARAAAKRSKEQRKTTLISG